MSTLRLFYVASALVAAAAALPILATQTASLTGASGVGLSSVSPRTSPEHPELRIQMASLRDMHERLTVAGHGSGHPDLMNESERVMGEGVALMRRLKLGLGSAVAESGAVRTLSVTQAESDRITDYLSLMELLILLKEDRDAMAQPGAAGPTTERSTVQSPWGSTALSKSVASGVLQDDWPAATGGPLAVRST